MELMELLEPRILCDRCIHKKYSEESGGYYCRMKMVTTKLERKKCSEYIGSQDHVSNSASACYPEMFGIIYVALRKSDKKHNEFYQKYCKRCINRTGRNWCKRFARLTNEISR